MLCCQIMSIVTVTAARVLQPTAQSCPWGSHRTSVWFPLSIRWCLKALNRYLLFTADWNESFLFLLPFFSRVVANSPDSQPCLGVNHIWCNFNWQLEIEHGKLLLQPEHIANFQLKDKRWENEYFNLPILWQFCVYLNISGHSFQSWSSCVLVFLWNVSKVSAGILWCSSLTHLRSPLILNRTPERYDCAFVSLDRQL